MSILSVHHLKSWHNTDNVCICIKLRNYCCRIDSIVGWLFHLSSWTIVVKVNTRGCDHAFLWTGNCWHHRWHHHWQHWSPLALCPDLPVPILFTSHFRMPFPIARLAVDKQRKFPKALTVTFWVAFSLVLVMTYQWPLPGMIWTNAPLVIMKLRFFLKRIFWIQPNCRYWFWLALIGFLFTHSLTLSRRKLG